MPHSRKALAANDAISTALPGRTSAYGLANELTLASMRPTQTMKAFANSEIEPVSRNMEAAIPQRMRVAAANSAGHFPKCFLIDSRSGPAQARRNHAR
jgi:hypothetical protein